MPDYYREETSSIDETPARELAATIIDDLPNYFDLVEDGEEYFRLEDELTEIINNYFLEKERVINE